MNSIEEQLWDYIDGACTVQEQQAIAMLIATNAAYKSKYNELLKLNAEFAAVELDEPPMAFTYNVMETIRTEQALKPLKAAINKRIVLGIAAFFLLTITVLVILTISNVNWYSPDADVVVIPDINLKPVGSLFTTPVVKGFLFFDVVVGLFLLDTYLRRKAVAKQL